MGGGYLPDMQVYLDTKALCILIRAWEFTSAVAMLIERLLR